MGELLFLTGMFLQLEDKFRVTDLQSGGKSSTDEDGGRRLMSSQFETGTGIRDLINNLRGKWPMIIIMGKDETHCHLLD